MEEEPLDCLISLCLSLYITWPRHLNTTPNRKKKKRKEKIKNRKKKDSSRLRMGGDPPPSCDNNSRAPDPLQHTGTVD